MSDRFEEFKEQCIEQGKVKRLDLTGQKREAERFSNQSKYHMTAAEELLGSEADLIAIVEGYYSMLHKANEALALAGFKPDSHKCTMLGIRGVFERSDLAKDLQEGMDERVNVDYYMDPEKSGSEHLSNPDDFIENKAEPFIQEINALINSEELG